MSEEERLIAHNADSSRYSKRYSPWELEAYTAFKDKATAEEFERYLKSGSGFAFLKKRLLPPEVARKEMKQFKPARAMEWCGATRLARR